jgi:aminoglycoside/choline kinase family phosphotransferase
MIPQNNELIQFAREALGIGQSVPVHITPVAGGGSKRSFHRITYEEGRSSAIYMHYDLSLAENKIYAAIARFLRGIDVPAPQIIAHDTARGFIVMEDLGDTDLWSYRHETWSMRRTYYRKTLAIAQRLHSFPIQDFPIEDILLMEGFNASLYQWERNYFLENFVSAVCGIELSPSDSAQLEDELKALSERLETVNPTLVHRDFQSQNIMICKDNPVLIDFQGMRFGNFLYDLGSLLYDPYVTLTEDERMELLQYYYELCNRDDWNVFQENFREASAQRLMQALGAYGYLGLKRGLPDFLKHIPSGVANLIDASARAKRLPLLHDLALKCQQTLNSSPLPQ